MTSSRERILEATYECVARLGMAKTTMEDIARQADLSRATLYRAFPGGRDEVLDAVITWEVARFFGRINDAIHPEELDAATVLEHGLLAAHDALEHHELLQRLLRDEADQLVPSLATVMPMVVAALADWYRPRLEQAALQDGVDPAEASEFVFRMALSHLGTGGRWDLADPAQVRELVRDRLLAGILT
ncbi:MAG: TetR/AcrR family transcriptional regulator [Actinomycetota bacterium]|nr:TetR/AcrR family transcriptional regulator [Actinomycetota bacterium]